MRYALPLAALAALGSALPQPVLVVVTVTTDIFVTVTAASNHKAQPNGFWGFRGGWHHRPAASSSTEVPAVQAPAAPTTVQQIQAPETPAPAPSPPPPAPAPPAPEAAQTSAPVEVAAPPPPTTTQEAVVTPVPQAPAAPAGGSYSDAVLYHHNVHRSNHSAPAMAWNQTLADIAAQIGQSCKYGHNT
jgi:hypothetical protein